MEEYNWPKISLDTPIEELQRIHRSIWQYVVEHGTKPSTPYAYDCVACEYAMFKRSLENSKGSRCRYCPINWDETRGRVNCCSLYSNWTVESTINSDSEKARGYALKIRDVPFKKGEQ